MILYNFMQFVLIVKEKGMKCDEREEEIKRAHAIQKE